MSMLSSYKVMVNVQQRLVFRRCLCIICQQQIWLTAWFCFPAINKHRTIKTANISFKQNIKGSTNSNCMNLHVSLSNMCLSLCTNNTILLSRKWSLIPVIRNTFVQSICISLHARNIILSHTLTSAYLWSLLTQTSAPTVTFWQL